MWPTNENVVEVAPVRETVVKVETKSEGDTVVKDQPTLFGETYFGLFGANFAEQFGGWCKHPLHQERAEEREQDDPVCNVVDIFDGDVINGDAILILDKVL